MRTRINRYFGVLARKGSVLVLAVLTTVSVARADTAVIDCPMRDVPYSSRSPLMDILLNPQAVAIVNEQLDGALDQLPKTFASAEAPSFSAILTLESIVGMAGLDRAVLEPINRALADLPVTAADRIARCKRYDQLVPEFALGEGAPRVLVFEKMTGFRDGPSVEAASATFQQLAEQEDWDLVITELGGVMTADILALFDVVVWNNVSGDVLTLSQRAAFEDYIHQGGGFVGVHGSGGDPIYFWDWYVDTLIGARFIGHPSDPQFQDATIHFETTDSGIESGLGAQWEMNDEWYSFRESARIHGATVIATIDESTYSQRGRWGQNVSMGEDHPIVWSRCVGEGRSFYSAIGHRPEVYSDPRYQQLLIQGINWAATSSDCVR
jgi:type 1 glutamine amidotransferase